MSNFASGKKAFSFSDRSGLRFPYDEMIYEPGTHLWVHISETDGSYNAVEHPQGRIKLPPSDKQALATARNRPMSSDDISPPWLCDQDGVPLVFTILFGQDEYLGYTQ